MPATAPWSLYPYDPVKPLPIIFAIIVFTLAAIHVYQSFFRFGWRYFGGVMLWASSVWVAGFICRAYSVYHTHEISIFITQYVLVLVGPPLYAASEYFILGRLMEYLPYHAPMHPGRVISTFIFFSAAIETLTANGAATSAGFGRDPGRRQSGLSCIKAALILQTCVEALYFSLVLQIELRCRRAKNFPRHVRIVCYVLYVTSGMMIVRCIVRAVEGFEEAACDITAPGYRGYCGYIAMHEWMLWVFEVANITLFIAALAFFPPGRYLPRDPKVYLDPYDGQSERHGPGFAKADKRPLWLTIVDPWDLFRTITGEGRKFEPFWETEHELYVSGGYDKRERPHALLKA